MIGGNHDDDSKMADERILEVIRTVRWEDSPS
jgi:Fe-S-cluster formation regulator IscX/YfhJ